MEWGGVKLGPKMEKIMVLMETITCGKDVGCNKGFQTKTT